VVVAGAVSVAAWALGMGAERGEIGEKVSMNFDQEKLKFCTET
jgi:hypothetical protein